MENGPASIMPRAMRESAVPPACASSKSLDLRVGVWAALAGVCILAGVSFVTHRPKVAAATAPLVGAWHDGGEEWLVLNADGTGARTRPDPTWGTLRYTFRWRAEGSLLQMTEQRVAMPGGSQTAAGDLRAPFFVARDADALALGAQNFRRHKP